jgi:predicted GNAT family N-acyltransferase
MIHIVLATTKEQLIDHFRIRGEVFIQEQAVPWEEEFDDADKTADLFNVVYGHETVGTARLVGQKIGRVALLKPYRSKGIGKILMLEVEKHAIEKGIQTLQLAAQTAVIAFYEACGYQAYGDTFLDANIPHRMMEKRIKL